MSWDSQISEQLHMAFRNRDVAEFKRLLLANPECLRNEDGSDYWMRKAVTPEGLPFLQALLELGVDVNETHDHGNPDDPFYQPEGAILWAASQGHLEIVQWLLEHGAKINYVVQGVPRCLPLSYAASNGHLNVVKLLVEHGADIHATWRGINAITQAEDFGHFEVRDYLHSLGARTLRETTPPDFASAQERFLKDLVQRVGPLADWRLEIPGQPLITLHLIPASSKCPMHSVFTVGLSDRPLPEGRKELACTELRCILAADWPVTESALQDPVWNWPVTWLAKLARELREADRIPDPPVFMNGTPPAPIAPNTRLAGWMALKSVGEGIQAPDYRWIDMHSLFPIYPEEEILIRESGVEELVNRLQQRHVPLQIDAKRVNVADDS